MAFDLTPATWQAWCLAILALTMAMAVESDLRRQRIPNGLVVSMLLAGVVLHAIGPDNGGEGILSYFPGALGVRTSLLGALVGLGLLLPLYLLRAMGAGDVKLLAALGAFAGPVEIVSLALVIFVAGGLLAIARLVWTRKLRFVLGNVALILVSLGSGERAFDPASQSGGRMPYGMAFAGGLFAYGYWRLHGGPPLISY